MSNSCGGIRLSFLILALGAVVLAGCNPFGSKLTAACEEVLKARLRSPSGYDRIKVSEYSREVPIDEYRAIMISEKRSAAEIELTIRGFEAGRELPVEFTQYIEYDAPNAYGTLIRGLAECKYVSRSGRESGASEFTVRVDGRTKTEYLLEQIKASPS